MDFLKHKDQFALAKASKGKGSLTNLNGADTISQVSAAPSMTLAAKNDLMTRGLGIKDAEAEKKGTDQPMDETTTAVNDDGA